MMKCDMDKCDDDAIVHAQYWASARNLCIGHALEEIYTHAAGAGHGSLEDITKLKKEEHDKSDDAS